MLELMLSALKADAMLAALPVYHQASPSGCRYPNIVYNVISDVPALHADNQEIQSRITVRIHIVTRDGSHHAIYKVLNSVMKKLGFMRVQATELYEDNLKIKVIDCRIGVDS